MLFFIGIERMLVLLYKDMESLSFKIVGCGIGCVASPVLGSVGIEIYTDIPAGSCILEIPLFGIESEEIVLIIANANAGVGILAVEIVGCIQPEFVVGAVFGQGPDDFISYFGKGAVSRCYRYWSRRC